MRRETKLLMPLLLLFLLLFAQNVFADDIPEGILTGFLFMGISRLTEEKIGYGDSLLIIVLGTFLGMWKLLILLLGAFGLAAAVSILLMIKRKFTRKSMIPFVPFLTVAYMGEMLGGMLSGGV